MRHIILGFGEVGKALQKVLKCNAHDPNIIGVRPDDITGENFPFYWVEGDYSDEKFDVMHVSFPYFDGFVEEVSKYQQRFQPSLTIIHSSVPIGTSAKCGAVHSPIRGVHPNLELGMRTFTKYFGGEKANEAAKIFEELGIKTHTTDRAENTEAGKLWDTTQYGLAILLERYIWDFCEKNNLDFNIVYTEFNQSYNEGYQKLGRPEVARPHLKHMPGQIGGHCVRQNAHLLDKKIAELFDKSI